jgi:hypothetical protein
MDDQRTDREAGGKKFRKLRIAWSVMCGILCVLLIMLWMRSYTTLDQIAVRANITSTQGRIYIGESFKGTGSPLTLFSNDLFGSPVYVITGRLNLRPVGSGIVIPLYSLVIISAALAAAAWLPWHFSLRTLLIATALMALGFGLIVWLR